LPTQRLPSAQVRPESPPAPGAGIDARTLPVAGSILSMRDSAIWYRCLPSKAVPASAGAVQRARDFAALRIDGDQLRAGGGPDAAAVVADAAHLAHAGEGTVLAHDLGRL
jgi:hypothetical protein